MRLAIFYTSLFYFDGQNCTADVIQHVSFPPLKEYFDEIYVIAGVKNTQAIRGVHRVDLQTLKVLALPSFTSGYQLYVLKFPYIVAHLLKLFLDKGKDWDVVLLWEPTVLNQVVFLLCKAFRKPVALRMTGRHDMLIWETAKYKSPWRRPLSWFHSRWVRTAEYFFSRTVPILTDGNMDFAPKGLRGKVPKRGNPAVVFGIDGIPNPERFLGQNAQQAPMENSPFRVLSIQRGHPQKGLEYLLEAIALLRERDIDARLDLVGPLYGEAYQGYEYFLRRRARELGIENVTRFWGALERGSQFYKLYDEAHAMAVTCATQADGVPKVVFEALAKGIPVVATKVGGMPMVIRHRENGILVEPRNARSLADGLQLIAENNDLRERTIQTGKAEAPKYADHEAIKQLIAIIESALPDKGGVS
ncbi:MAG: glycosyltransferase [Dehalococcoidia bacterium]